MCIDSWLLYLMSYESMTKPHKYKDKQTFIKCKKGKKIICRNIIY